jgi:hypothetical protein
VKFILPVILISVAGWASDGDLVGVESPYTKVISDFVKTWPPQTVTKDPSDFSEGIRLHCYSLPESSDYVGLLQEMWVHSDFKDLVAVIDDFDNYKNVFTGFKTVSAEKTDPSKFMTSWEQFSGFFLVANIKYRMIYFVSQPNPKRKIYRYQLRDANDLKYSDGAIIIEDWGPNLTRYIELDFILGDSGLANVLGLNGKIVKETVKGMALADMDFKIRAENPNWDFDKIHDKTDELLKSVQWEKALKERSPWSAP